MQYRTTALTTPPRSHDSFAESGCSGGRVRLAHRAKGTMTVFAGKAVVSGSNPSVRAQLMAGGAFASAGILVLSLLVVPPSDSDAAKSEVHTVQYASLALPAASSWVPLLEKVNVGNQAITVIPVTQLISAGGFGSATNPASRQVNNAALAATPSGTDLGAIFLQIVGPIVLFAPLFIF